MQGGDLAVTTKTIAISEERSAVECAGHSDEGIVPQDVGVTSDVGKAPWGVRDRAFRVSGLRTGLRQYRTVDPML